MNPYFKPRPPEPRAGALGIIIRSMLCALAVVIVGAGIWLGVGAILKEGVSAKLVDDGLKGPPTNNVEHVATKSP